MYDSAIIKICSGKGGNGAISGRREKFVPKGGPDGGDGGDGGSVLFRCDANEGTLIKFKYRRVITAGDGGHGRGGLKHGKKGEDVLITLPVGTEVWEAGSDSRLVMELLAPGTVVEVARGGTGGRGNARFRTSTNRFPLLAEAGEQGKSYELRLELKMLADVGIVGAPNAGKSSLLAALTNATPRIAEFPFSSIDPCLGVAEHKGQPIVLADIPGLIEGAHEGAGLGHEFLKHIERTRVLVHVVDVAADDSADAYRQVRGELEAYGGDLGKKPEIVAINKIDIPEAGRRCAGLVEELTGVAKSVHCISAVARQGLQRLLDNVVQALAESGRASEETGGRVRDSAEPVVLRPRPVDERPTVQKRGGRFEVSCTAAERIAAMVDPGNWDARIQLHDQLRRLGVLDALEKAGIREGQVLRIGKLEWEWQ